MKRGGNGLPWCGVDPCIVLLHNGNQVFLFDTESKKKTKEKLDSFTTVYL